MLKWVLAAELLVVLSQLPTACTQLSAGCTAARHALCCSQPRVAAGEARGIQTGSRREAAVEAAWVHSRRLCIQAAGTGTGTRTQVPVPVLSTCVRPSEETHLIRSLAAQ
jgi:hypothetical protein